MSSHSQTLHSRLFPTNRAASSWRHGLRLLFLSILLSVNTVPAYAVAASASASEVARSTASTAASQTFMLVAAETIPGNNPDNLTPVLRYEFTDMGALQPLSSIPPYPASAVQDPSFVAFSPQGELFVANRHGNVGNGIGSIARFTLDATHNIVANSVITGNSVEAVAGLAFSPAGELFAANFANGLVSRFTFDAQGQAIANGTFNTDELYNEALVFSADGELFSTHSSNLIRRWRIDSATRAVTANGIIAVPAASRLHGLAFSADNELFAADPDTNLIFRIRFDASGNATSNGTISAVGGALGLAFSPTGEMFVTGHFTGGISRFVFDANGLATQNGETIATNSLGGAAILQLPEAAPETDSISFVSDSSWNVYDADPANGSATDLGSAQAVCLNAQSPVPCPTGATLYGFAGFAWPADLSAIPGAKWLWAPNVDGTVSPADLRQYYFSKKLSLSERPLIAVFFVAADDFAEVRVNGVIVGTIGSITNGSIAAIAEGTLTTFDIAPYLVPGDNVITVRAQNGPASFANCAGSCPYQQNPAGVAFGGTIRYAVCNNTEMLQEAESGVLSGNFVVSNDSAASGGQYVSTTDGAGSFWNGPIFQHRAEYCFNVPTDGDYRVRTRVAAFDQLSDSFYVQLDGAPARGYLWDVLLNSGYALDNVSDRSVIDPVEVSLTAGVHIVTIYQREDGTRLDTIELKKVGSGTNPVPVCAGLSQEAEDGALSGNFEIGTDSTASGGNYIHLPNGAGDFWNGPNARQKAEYCFNVPNAGTYRIDGKVYGADNLSDSFYVKVEGAPDKGYLWDILPNTSYLLDSVNDRNQFLDLVTFPLSSGQHTVTVYAREDGTRLDTIQLVETVPSAQSRASIILAKGVLVTIQPEMSGMSEEFDFSTISLVLVDAETRGENFKQEQQADRFGQVHFDGMTPGDYLLQFSSTDGMSLSSRTIAAQPGMESGMSIRVTASADERVELTLDVSAQPAQNDISTQTYLPLITR